jgi:hypothetical protein
MEKSKSEASCKGGLGLGENVGRSTGAMAASLVGWDHALLLASALEIHQEMTWWSCL